MRRVCYLIAGLLLCSCDNGIDVAEDGNFIITNSLDEHVAGKIYPLASHINRRDSISFVIPPHQTKNINWSEPAIPGGEGSFEIRIDSVLNQRFGYFTNGAILHNEPFEITIASDTIVIR